MDPSATLEAEPVQPENVTPGTDAPYQQGDRCEVLVGLLTASGIRWEWIMAVVLTCEQPRGARRFVLSVANAQSIHSAYINSRVYCNADGRGDEVRPL